MTGYILSPIKLRCCCGRCKEFLYGVTLINASFILHSILKKIKGFYLYAFGVKIDPNISGGSPSWDNFQTVNSVATGLRSGGGYNADPRGNFNNLGWSTSYTDSTWFLATNYPESVTDLYSVAHHEIGHCLALTAGTRFSNL